MKALFELLRRLWKADAFSPTAFLMRAILLVLFFCLSELLGLREYTTFLSGTSANLNVSWRTAATLGLIHLLLYVGFILLVPVFLITAALLAAWNQRTGIRVVLRWPVALALGALVLLSVGSSPPEPAKDELPPESNPVVEGNSKFALDLSSILKDQDRNLIVSPFSVSSALAMVCGGARANTERQMAQALYLLDRGQAHRNSAVHWKAY